MDTSNTILSPELQEATEALAFTLLSAEPIVAYHQAKARFDSDPQARDLLDRLSAAQREIRQRQAQGGINQADLDRLRALQREQRDSDSLHFVLQASADHRLTYRRGGPSVHLDVVP